jgi:hypothetical protein
MTVTRVDHLEPIMHHVDERRSELSEEVTP